MDKKRKIKLSDLKISGGRKFLRKLWLLFVILLILLMILPQFFGQYFFFIDLLTHFQLQLIFVGLLLLLFGLILGYNHGYILIFLIIFTAHTLIFIHPTTLIPKSLDEVKNVDVYFINSNYFVDDVGPILAQIDQANPRSVAVVESNPIILNGLRERYGDPISVQGVGALSCAIFSKDEGGEEVVHRAEFFGYNICGAKIDGYNYVLIHPYPPLSKFYFSKQKEHFYEVQQIIDNYDSSGEKFLLLGDFNSTYYSPTFRQYFAEHFQINNYSWSVGEPEMLPIDHALSNEPIEVFPGKRTTSDHSPLYITLD